MLGTNGGIHCCLPLLRSSEAPFILLGVGDFIEEKIHTSSYFLVPMGASNSECVGQSQSIGLSVSRNIVGFRLVKHQPKWF